MPTVAITGANGFIGQHLCERFVAAEWKVRPIVRSDFHSDRIEELASRANVIVHAAGATRAPSVAQLRASNVSLTERVVDVARTVNAQRLILISSQAATGPARARDVPVDETTQPSPVEPYGDSKLDAEKIVRASNVPFTIMRPSAVYGPGDEDFRAMFALARRGVAIHPSNRTQWISIVHVRDVVDGIVAAATQKASIGQTYFLANDEPVQWNDLFRAAAQCAKKTLWLNVNLPRALVRFGAKVGDAGAKITGQAGLLTSGKVALAEAPFWICSSARAKRDLGWTPRVPLQAGLQETYDWYDANGWR